MNMGAVSRIQMNIMIRTSASVNYLGNLKDGDILPVAWIETVIKRDFLKKNTEPATSWNYERRCPFVSGLESAICKTIRTLAAGVVG